MVSFSTVFRSLHCSIEEYANLNNDSTLYGPISTHTSTHMSTTHRFASLRLLHCDDVSVCLIPNAHCKHFHNPLKLQIYVSIFFFCAQEIVAGVLRILLVFILFIRAFSTCAVHVAITFHCHHRDYMGKRTYRRHLDDTRMDVSS